MNRVALQDNQETKTKAMKEIECPRSTFSLLLALKLGSIEVIQKTKVFVTAEANVLCCFDDAALCWASDKKVHDAMFIR
ncbi:hypothetical protein RchiOBHm_Chr1g0379931 [Rosa chinensis]|uniref:Uncharacterized protein n=1 Tax=Rosa chinensis TaxID=74649 RepID=A0A2P6SNP4_ROSCH|nr:hypothetical protein RchiOBHm_Chr1g0379931 [Rosa chinensis]